jgi:DNA-binding sugar fermentation-stimulating protein
MRAEPLRGDDGQTVEGMTQCFPDALSAIDGTHARQHMRGVGALASAGFEPLALAAALQDGVEQALFGGPYDQPGAELA